MAQCSTDMPVYLGGVERTQGCGARNGGDEVEFQCLNTLSLEMPSISLIELCAQHILSGLETTKGKYSGLSQQ